MESSTYHRKKMITSMTDLIEVAFGDGLEPHNREHEYCADDQVVHMKTGKINCPTLDLLADFVEASLRTDNFTPEMRNGCRNDNEIKFATLFKRNPVGNRTSHPKRGHNEERIADNKRARHSEESLADSKRVSSDTSFTAGKSPCQNKDMDIEKGDPETDI